MAFQRPTLAELVVRIQADFVSRLELTGAVLRRAIVYVFSRVIAGATHMLHGHLEYLARQLFPDKSDREYLIRQARLFLGTGPIAPGYAKAQVLFTGRDGAIIPQGTILARSDGAEYLVDIEVALAVVVAWAGSSSRIVGDIRKNGSNVYRCIQSGTTAASGGPTTTAASISDGTVLWVYISATAGTYGSLAAAVYASVTAAIAGSAGTLTNSAVLSFESPISNVDSNSVVITTTTDGSDEESTEALRTRLLARLAEPARGGTDADWIYWAKLVAGVTRAWVYPQALGPGSVLVRFVRDLDASPIPDAGEVAAVQAMLDLMGPAHATPTAFAPTLLSQNFTLTVVPDTAAVHAAVTAELEDLFDRTGSPGGTILISAIRTAIGNASGLTDYTLVTPSADLTHTANQLPALGTITF